MLRHLIFLLLAAPVYGQETMIREVFDPATDTHVEVLALFSKPSPGGYFPVRVKIANNLGNDRPVRLDFSSTSDYSKDLETSSSFFFTAAAESSLTRDILVPICPPRESYGNSVLITANLSGSLGEATNTIQSAPNPDQPSVLLSDALFTPNASTLDSEIQKKLGGSSRSRSGEFAARFDPRQAPDDWLAFSGYDSVILTDTDWSNTPPGGRNAVLSWVRLGGQLIVYSTGSATAAALGLDGATSFGSVTLRPVPSSLKLDASEVVTLVTGNATKPRQVSLRNDFQSRWPLQGHFGTQTFRYSLFVIVLVVFGILVGPVNFFVFAKSGQRHRLFITTPVISLVASLILIALILIQDGFGGSGVRRALMEVRPDRTANAAYLHQEQFCRTGVLTRSNFTVNTPSALQPVPIAASRWARYTAGSGSGGRFDLQPADGTLHASGDWFQSRSEHGHILSAVVPTRGRIEKTNTPHTCLSTFEFPIDTLFLLDDAAQWHRADHIIAGKSFTLTPVDASVALAALRAEADAFAKRNQRFLLGAITRPGHFVAVASQAPGIDTHPGIRWKETRTVLTGPVLGKN